MAAPHHARPDARLHLAGFFGFGPAYVWSEAERNDVYYDFAAWRRLAQTAERGLFSTLFLGDSQRLREHLGRITDHSVTGRPDQLVLFAHLAAVTERIGLVATLNTTFTDPVDLARRLATVDVLSGGRAGWNVVTTDNDWTGENFRRGGEVGHSDRYRNAEEHLGTVEALWAAWPEGAVPGSDAWSVPGALSPVVRGARRAWPQLPPSPQGQPVLFQAGSPRRAATSPPGTPRGSSRGTCSSRRPRRSGARRAVGPPLPHEPPPVVPQTERRAGC
ncbi:LLM class flavin-dependent oxidoreductase [Pseudonocardia sp. NPDC049154]|uniref:LLM class flavin-dependent oxidoreductase n=1 Tax=Pseudonocardia sp. NPDC049154 TaxID=3155501 RepID=UPI003411D478